MALLGSLPASAQSGPVIWAASSLVRIGPTDPPGAARIDLSAARAEYEAFQLGIGAPAGGLTNVNVSISDLTGTRGGVLTRSNFTLYREYYIKIRNGSPDLGGSNRPLGPGWYADALIPFLDPDTGAPPVNPALPAVPFWLAAGQNQPIWIDLYVPGATVPDTYSGTVTVTSAQGQASVAVSLKVWSFRLPLRPSLESSVALQVPAAFHVANQKVLLQHRLMPRIVNTADQQALINQFGLRSSSLWFCGQYDPCRFPDPPAASLLAAALTRSGPARSYLWSSDDVSHCGQALPALQLWSRTLHGAGIRNLVASTPTSGLRDDGSGTGRSLADVWILAPRQFIDSAADVAAALAKGDQLWSTNGLVEDGYSPKWEIDFAPINYRIQAGFLNQSQGATGLFYWNANNWQLDPWNNVEYQEHGQTYPGEGTLVYPGGPVGLRSVVPSMRLKWLREGVEDYEYVEMLRRAGRGDWALGVVKQAAQDWAHWTQDPVAFEQARRELGAELDRLYATPAGRRPIPAPGPVRVTR